MLRNQLTFLSQWIYTTVIKIFRKYYTPLIILMIVSILWDEFKALYLWTKLKSLNEFKYPQLGDIYQQIEELEKMDFLTSYDTKPINFLNYKLTNFDKKIHGNKKSYKIVNIVKSNVNNLPNREMIRKTWGNMNCTFNKIENIRTFFLIGKLPDNEKEKETQLNEETIRYQDILRYDLIDTYYNNTYKLMVALDLVYRQFSNASFMIVTDDDYFLHPPNLFDYLKKIHRLRYPFYVGGGVWYNAQPIRGGNEKWGISLEDYPFTHFPDYPAGGNLIISMPMVRLLALGFQTLKYMPFDDVLLGILLFKLGIAPENLINMCKTRVECDPNRVDKIISSHGFRLPSELLTEWNLHRFYEFCGV